MLVERFSWRLPTEGLARSAVDGGLDGEELARLYGPWAGRTPADAARLLAGYPGRWWIAGGWAIEAFTGRSRHHSDLDLEVLRVDLPLLRRHLAARLDLWTADAGALRPLLPEDNPEGGADTVLPPGCGQVWARASGAIATHYFHGTTARRKADRSLVTQADVEIERFLRQVAGESGVLRRPGSGEHHVPALDVRAHVRETEFRAQGGQVTHRQLSSSADIDRAQQRDKNGHATESDRVRRSARMVLCDLGLTEP